MYFGSFGSYFNFIVSNAFFFVMIFTSIIYIFKQLKSKIIFYLYNAGHVVAIQ